MSTGKSAPQVIHGWTIFAHPLFLTQVELLAQQVEVWGVELENGQRVTVGSEAQAVAFARQAGSRPTRIARRESSLISGTPEQVKARLDALQAEEQLDELIIDTPISDGPARLHSLRLLAQAHYGKEVLNVL